MSRFDVWTDADVRLTGRTRVRSAVEHLAVFARKDVLVLQFEETYCRMKIHSSEKTGPFLRWRDAQATDFLVPAGPEVLRFDKALTADEVEDIRRRWQQQFA